MGMVPRLLKEPKSKSDVNAHRSIPVHSARHHASLSLILRSAKTLYILQVRFGPEFLLRRKISQPVAPMYALGLGLGHLVTLRWRSGGHCRGGGPV
jgi:hypothetical protein